jgi:hypothetical protein
MLVVPLVDVGGIDRDAKTTGIGELCNAAPALALVLLFHNDLKEHRHEWCSCLCIFVPSVITISGTRAALRDYRIAPIEHARGRGFRALTNIEARSVSACRPTAVGPCAVAPGFSRQPGFTNGPAQRLILKSGHTRRLTTGGLAVRRQRGFMGPSD